MVDIVKSLSLLIVYEIALECLKIIHVIAPQIDILRGYCGFVLLNYQEIAFLIPDDMVFFVHFESFFLLVEWDGPGEDHAALDLFNNNGHNIRTFSGRHIFDKRTFFLSANFKTY